MLLKEKDETIRMQATLIETQNELLRQANNRKKIPTASSVKTPKSIRRHTSSNSNAECIDVPTPIRQNTFPTLDGSNQLSGSVRYSIPLNCSGESPPPYTPSNGNCNESSSNGTVPKQTGFKQKRSNSFRRSNSINWVRGDNDKESTKQLLADLEKQTNYELRRLDSIQNGKRHFKEINYCECTPKR